MDYSAKAPHYFNRVNSEDFKDVKKLLFRAGDILQNTELNEVQSLFTNELNALTKEFIDNGQVLKGGEIEVLYDADSYSVTNRIQPRGIALPSSQPFMYILDGETKKVKQYNLIEPMDIINTVIFSGNSVNVSKDDIIPLDIEISTDGKYLFMIGSENNNITRYEMKTVWDLSSINTEDSISSSFLLGAGTGPLNNTYVYNPTHIQFDPTGKKLYVCEGKPNEAGYSSYGYYRQYELTEAYNLLTIGYKGTYNFSKPLEDANDNTVPGDFSPEGMTFSNNGEYLFLIGAYSHKILAYSLSTPWSLTTAEPILGIGSDYAFIDITPTDGINKLPIYPYNICNYESEDTFTLIGTDTSYISQFTFETPWDVDTVLPNINENNLLNDTLKIQLRCNEGELYFSSFFNNVEEKLIEVKDFSTVPESEEYYKKYTDTLGVVVTFVEDDSLRDPATEFDNFGYPGAYALVLNTEWYLKSQLKDINGTGMGLDNNSQEFIPVYEIIDSEIFPVVKPTPFEEKVIQVSAKYDRNAHGNYVVKGMGVKFLNSEYGKDGDKVSGPFNFDIGSGSVNIDGYNFEPRVAETIQLPELGESGIGNDTGIIFSDNDSIIFDTEGYYELTKTPIYRIHSIAGEIEGTKDQPTLASGEQTLFICQNLNRIISITRDEEPTIVEAGVEYNMPSSNSDSINFTVDFDGGTNIVVTYLQTITSYNLYDAEEGENGYVSPTNRASIYLKGYYPGEDMYVNYYTMLPRIDSIIIDSTGKISYIKGVPALLYPQTNNSIDEKRQLSLAEVLLVYGMSPKVTITGQRVFQMKDVQRILNAEERNQYNIAKLTSLVNIMMNNPTAAFRNSFVDNFTSDKHRWRPGSSEQGTALCVSGNLLLNIEWENFNIDTSEIVRNISSNDDGVGVLWIGLDSTKINGAIISQPWYTKNRKINEYLEKLPPPPPPPIPNVPPKANAGPNQEVDFNTDISIIGSGVDNDGLVSRYSWEEDGTVISTSAGFTYNSSIADLHFLTLTVTDDDGATDSDSMTVRVTAAPIPPNQGPLANAGPNKEVQVNSGINIIGSGVDIDGSISSYIWKTDGDVISTSSTFNYTPTSTGNHVLTLTVTDDDGKSDSDSVTVKALPEPPEFVSTPYNVPHINIIPNLYKWVTKTTYRNFVASIEMSSTESDFYGHNEPWDPEVGVNLWRDYASQQNIWWDEWNLSGLSTVRARLDATNAGFPGPGVTNTVLELMGSTSSVTSNLLTFTENEVLIPEVEINMTAPNGSFTANGEVSVKFGKLSITKGAPYYANSNGGLDIDFDIPANKHLSGIKEVSALSLSWSGDEDTNPNATAYTSFTATPLHEFIDTTTNYKWRSNKTSFIDPIAQSFKMKTKCNLDGVTVYFEDRPTTLTTMFIAETSAGFPDREKFIAFKEINPSDLILGDAGTYFEFDTKIVLQANKEYAFIVLCGDSEGTLRAAEMGQLAKQNENDAEEWLTSQAYSVGVLYNSANNSTWTPYQFEDVKFELFGCSFINNPKIIELDPISVTDACDVMLLANSVQDEGTSVKYEITVDKYGELKNTFEIYPYQQKSLELEETYTGDIYLTITLDTTILANTPKLDPNIQMSIGTVQVNEPDIYPPFDSSIDVVDDYISEFWDFEPVDGKIQVHLDQYVVDNTSGIKVFYDDADYMPNDELYTGAVWVEIPLVSTRFLVNNWRENKYETPNGTPIIRPLCARTRIKIEMGTNSILKRPVAGNLRAVLLGIE